MMRPCRKSRRRGYTLVETLVAVTLLGSLLGTVTLTLSVMYRADRNLRDCMEQERTLEQFTVRLRLDAHQALSASVNKPAQAGAPTQELLLKSTGDQTIRYTLRPRDVERVVRRGESMVHRETYGLAATGAGWGLGDDRKPAMVSVSFRQPAPGGGQPAADTVRIDAVVHLVHRPP